MNSKIGFEDIDICDGYLYYDYDDSLDEEEVDDEELEGVDDNLYTSYLKDIGRYPLLTADEEFRCGMDLKLKDKIFILTDKKINGKVYSVIDLESVFVSINDIQTFKCVFDLISDYYFNSYKIESIDNKVLGYYWSLYSKLVRELGIPDVSLLNKYFSDNKEYDIFNNFDVSRRIESNILIEQVSMCIRYFKAREMMMNHNLRLVVRIAKKYCKYMDIMDLIISGNIGLMEAVDKFDVDRGTKFSTYASWEIKKEILGELSNNSSNIRIPINKKNSIFSFWKRIGKLNNEYGRKLTIYEIAKEFNMTLEEVNNYILYSKNTTSLDEVIDPETGTTLMDSVAISNINVEKDVLNDDLKLKLDEILSNFSDKEIQIIKSRYDINGGKFKTLKELAVDFGVSKQGINNMEARTLKKMRKMATKWRLDEYL